MIIWDIAARVAERQRGAQVNWEEEYFICPDCGKPIRKSDWRDTDILKKQYHYYCPICGELLGWEM